MQSQGCSGLHVSLAAIVLLHVLLSIHQFLSHTWTYISRHLSLYAHVDVCVQVSPQSGCRKWLCTVGVECHRSTRFVKCLAWPSILQDRIRYRQCACSGPRATPNIRLCPSSLDRLQVGPPRVRVAAATVAASLRMRSSLQGNAISTREKPYTHTERNCAYTPG